MTQESSTPATKLSDTTVEEIRYYLLGTCNAVEAAMNAFDLEGDDVRDEIEDRLLDGNGIQVCETCGWWVEVGEMDEDGNCYQCSTEDGND